MKYTRYDVCGWRWWLLEGVEFGRRRTAGGGPAVAGWNLAAWALVLFSTLFLTIVFG